jgi:predicted Zn-dependent protease
MNAFKNIFVPLFLLYSFTLQGQVSETMVKEYNKMFTTYPFSDPNTIPSPKSTLYPYTHFDTYTNEPVQKEWKVVELENPYIRVMILPEVGGKIWTAIEKSTNRPFIYYNHVIKFRDLCARGPYTSGGIESNFGVMGHTANVATPVDYKVVHNEDGSVSCIIGTLDLITRTTWRTEINLPNDKGYFTTRTHWYNNTSIEQPYYHWLNAGLPTKGNVEFLYPGNDQIGHDGEIGGWPKNTDNDKIISFYEQNDFGGPKSYHVLGQYSHFAGAYWHDYDFGMIRFGARDGKAGKKLWIWGLSEQGMIWEDILTDSDGQYWELQSGRQFNQNSEKSDLTPFKHTSFAPYGTDTWEEYWYPFLNTNGAVEANEYGALNLKYENGWLKMYFSAVQSINDSIRLKNGDHTIYSRLVKLAPMQVFIDSIKTKDSIQAWKAILGDNKLVYSFDLQSNILNRPLQSPADFDWGSAYGLYLRGKNLMDQKKFSSAEEFLTASLLKDPNFFPSIVSMSQIMYRNMRYPEALNYAKKALSIDAHAGDANYFYGIINKQLGNISDAMDGFDLASLTSEFRSAAYTELAGIYLKEKRFEKAVIYSQKATDFNRFNIAALQMEAIAFRMQMESEKANVVLNTISDYEKLSHFVNFERYMWSNKDVEKQIFIDMIRGEMPEEIFTELGVFYHNVGCVEEAKILFATAPSSTEAHYWMAYLENKPVDFANIKTTCSFPFRSETAEIMEKLIKTESNWKLKYHLALIYANRNRLIESNKLLIDCMKEPDDASFYAFRANMKSINDGSREEDLKKALELGKIWRFRALLGTWYLEKSEPEKAVSLIKPYCLVNPDDNNAGFFFAKSLLQAKYYKEANDLLNKIAYIPAEGNLEGMNVYREVKLMLAVEQINLKKYSKAIQFVKEAMLYPAKFGGGAPYPIDIDYRLEQWISYLCYVNLGQKEEAVSMLKKIVEYTPVVLVWGGISLANHLITAIAYDRLDKHDKAVYFIANEAKNSPQLTSVYQSLWENKKVRFDMLESSISTRVLDQLWNY